MQEFVPQVLRHTATDPDNKVGLTAFAVVELRQAIDDFGFGVFPYRTGIDKDDIGILEMRYGLVSALRQDTCHEFTVADVHLTPIGFDVNPSGMLGCSLLVLLESSSLL